MNGEGYPECGSPRAITWSARVIAGRLAASGVDSESSRMAASKRIEAGTLRARAKGLAVHRGSRVRAMTGACVSSSSSTNS